jgi:nitrile hydratase
MTYVTHADLGGTPNVDPIVREPEDERFHDAWEAQALAVTLAAGATGMWNLDMSRRARETLPDYARLTYYQIWIAALEVLLAERGMVAADELAAGRGLHPPVPVPRVLRAGDVPAVLAKGSPTTRLAVTPQRFQPGDSVRLRAHAVSHHTRLPGYARGKRGTVERVHGAHVFPDRHAHGLGEDPQWLYTIVFDGGELWGADAAPGHTVSIDAWDPYLEPAA